jgi:hypothetical protein
MRLLGTKTEKSHSIYLIINQVFKSIFSIENETLRLFLKKLFHVRENIYPLDSIKEGADEPVANDTCDVTYESNPGDMLHIPAEGNLLQAHYYHTSGTTDNQHRTTDTGTADHDIQRIPNSNKR